MKTLIAITLVLFAALQGATQGDAFVTPAGDISITPILHGTLVIEWNGQTIYVDPYGGAERFGSFNTPDLVLITHAHGDHLNKETLSGIDLSATELIAPQSVVDDLGEISFGKITAVDNYSIASRNGIRIGAVPMYNLPDDDSSRHPKGWGNGYILVIGGKKIYISGDTEDIPEMRSLENVDVAFVCMNLPYTMTVEAAADAVLQFKPQIVYPYHYRGQDGYSDVNKFAELVGEDPNIEVRLRNWYPN